jgi:multidrug transporter EmrE-like cation transporter
MSEWWTYHLSDFLLFSSRTYFRLFEVYNAAVWPAQLLAAVLGAAILALLWRGAARVRDRAIPAILAACWLWVAGAFLASRYATINWAAVYFAWAFVLEAGLLIWMGTLRRRLTFEKPADLTGRVGLLVLLFAMVLLPLVGPLLGRGWRSVQIFGVAPDPTVVATLGVLLLARGRGRGPLMVVPVLWCAITGATLLAMKAPEAWIPPLAAALAAALAFRQSRSARRNPDRHRLE